MGVSRYPVKDYSHRTTGDMWLYRLISYIVLSLKFMSAICNIFVDYKAIQCIINYNFFRAYSGNLYHNGEQQMALPVYTQGDYITCILDMDARTISFGKNGEEPKLAFEDVDATELYPCVMFYSSNPGERVCYLNVLNRLKTF